MMTLLARNVDFHGQINVKVICTNVKSYISSIWQHLHQKKRDKFTENYERIEGHSFGVPRTNY